MKISSLHQRRRPMARLAYASILFALMTTVASAQAPQPIPAAPRQAPGPAAQIHTNLPADSVTVTHCYKHNVYDPADNKIGEIMDVLVDRDGKVTALIVGVGGSSAWARRMSLFLSIRSGLPPRTTTSTTS